MADNEPRISEATHEAAERDARAPHTANEVPTPEEDAAAPTAADPAAAEAYEEYLETAAEAKGEGRIP